MNILVTYATRHGATRGIAERIATTLERPGHHVTLRPVEQAGDPADFDAFVIGAAAYAGTWLKDATAFVNRHRALLASRPVWLFSSGPLGTATVDAKGRDVRAAAEPKEFAELREALHPRDQRVFFGAFDPDAEPIGLMERAGARILRMMPAARAALPAGDFRDWSNIEAWAQSIARELAPIPVGAVPG